MAKEMKKKLIQLDLSMQESRIFICPLNVSQEKGNSAKDKETEFRY